MKNVIDLFSELGGRLCGFGADNATQAVMKAACRANGWFTPADVRRAVGAIARDMLSREKLEAWLGNYPAVPVAVPRRVLVVMAGNIPLVGFFDLLCTVVSGHRCLLKPSAKDTVLMEYVVGQLRDIDASVPVEFYDGVSPVNAVIATAAVAVEQRDFPAALSQISYTYYKTPDEVAGWLAMHDDELQCVVTECLPHSRRAAFGCAQSPALTDYPDDRDVIAWLAALN